MTQEELEKAEHFTANYYGLDRQMDILQEECAELIQAVSKIRRYGLSREENLIEEMADVEVMIDQIKILLNISEDKIRDFKIMKTEREIKRIQGSEKEA